MHGPADGKTVSGVSTAPSPLLFTMLVQAKFIFAISISTTTCRVLESASGDARGRLPDASCKNRYIMISRTVKRGPAHDSKDVAYQLASAGPPSSK